MQNTMNKKAPRSESLRLFTRRPERVRRTHQAIERAVRRVAGPIGTIGVLVGEGRLMSTAEAVSRAALEEHLVRRGRVTHGLEGMRLIAIADEVRATPSHLAPVVIACKEGRTILQWLAEDA